MKAFSTLNDCKKGRNLLNELMGADRLPSFSPGWSSSRIRLLNDYEASSKDNKWQINFIFPHQQIYKPLSQGHYLYVRQLVNCSAFFMQSPNHLHKLPYCTYSTSHNRYGDASLISAVRYRLLHMGSLSGVEHSPLLPATEEFEDGDGLIAENAIKIEKILSSSEKDSDLLIALDNCRICLSEDLVVQVLRRHRSNWKLALLFFNWASIQKDYSHEPKCYNEILDILGRMKQIRLMTQIVDEIPKDRAQSVINDRTFAILMNRYAAAHKVKEAIDAFYMRKDYGFELDLIGFQTLLMSLCRYKHVEEAEALFLQRQDEFPPVIKSRNIILNGWCVLGSLRDAKRFWNDIISSDCKPDLFTYSIFINALTKKGKLASAVKLFGSMWEKGCTPDVTICNCIIDALCFKKKIPEALEIFHNMNDKGCLPDVATYNSLIKHLCNIKRLEKVYKLLDEMEQRACLPNARTYCYILKTTQNPEQVTSLLLRMERTGCRKDSDICNLILNLYLKWNYQKGIRSIWLEMEKSGFGPDQRSYTVMIHRLHNQGKLDEALKFYEEMRSKGMIPEPRTKLLVKAIHLKRDNLVTP